MPRDALRSYLRGIALIAEKDMRIYYTKPPVLMFRLFISAFYVPRVLVRQERRPSHAVPWPCGYVCVLRGLVRRPVDHPVGEASRHLRTAPVLSVTVNTLILGDVVAGMLYGIIINVIILAAGTAAFGYAVSVTGVLIIAISLVLGAFCFSALGVLLASPASTNPPQRHAALKPCPLSADLHQRHFCADCEPPGDCKGGCGTCSPITYLVNSFGSRFAQGAPRSRS